MKKIIIPESLKDFMEENKDLLSRETVQMFPVSRSEEILQLHRDERADLIVIDLDSRGTAEEYLCRVIRSDDDLKKVSIVIVYSPETAGIGSYDACGANMFAEKPIDPGAFFSDISRLVGIAGREELRELVKVSVRVETDDDFFFASSLNISISGMLIQTNRILAAGSWINCSFYLDRKVTLEGRVVRAIRKAQDLFHYGIRFSDPDTDTKALIEEFLNGEEKDLNGL